MEAKMNHETTAIATHNDREKTRKRWYQIVHDFLQSGETRTRYCNAQNLGTHNLRYWVNKYQNERRSFIPIRGRVSGIESPKINARSAVRIPNLLCTLELGGEKRLKIESVEALAELKNILQGLV